MVSKIVRKSLFKNRLMIIGVAYIFLLAMVIISLALSVTGTMSNSYYIYKEDSNFEDMQIYTNPALDQYDDAYIEQVASEYNADYEQYEAKSYIDSNGVLYVFSSYNANSNINTLQVVEGNLPTNEGEIFLTENYAKKMEIKVGDKIIIDDYELTVAGYGYIPIYTMPINLETFQFPGEAYMPAYINEETFDKIVVPPASYTKTYLIDFQDDLTNEEIDVIAADIMENYKISVPQVDAQGNIQVNSSGQVIMVEVPVFLQAIPAYQHTNLEALGSIIPTVRKLLLTFATVIATLALVIAIVIFNAIFKNQRREIGIMRAEGLHKSELEFHYTKMLYITLLCSGFIGIIIGNVLSRILLGVFSSIYNLLILPIPTYIYFIIIGVWLVLVALMTLLVYLFSIRKNINIGILLLIKNIGKDHPPRFKLASKLTRLSYKARVKINMTLRHLSTPLILFIGVFAVSFLLLMVQVMAVSMFGMVQRDVATTNYDYQMTYSQTAQGEETQDAFLAFMTQVIDVPSEDSTIQVMAFKKDNDKLIMHDTNNNPIDSSDYNNGVVISYYTASKLELEVGETFVVKNPFISGETIELTINNITNNTTQSIIYADIDYIQELFKIDDNFITGTYIDESDLEEYKNKYPDAYYVSLATAHDSTNELNKLLYIIVGIVSVIATIVAFVSMFLISLISINEHKKTSFIMRTFGYSNYEINDITNSIHKWIILLAFIVSLPISWYLVTNVVLNKIGIVIIFHFHILYAVITLLFIYTIYFIASRLARYKIEHANLALQLKSDE